MISRYIVKGNIKARHQIFKIIRRQVTTGKDQMDSLAFFSNKVFLEKRSLNLITNCKDFHKLLYSYLDFLSPLIRTGKISIALPTIPRSATLNMGASGSLFIAMMVFAELIPTRC